MPMGNIKGGRVKGSRQRKETISKKTPKNLSVNSILAFIILTKNMRFAWSVLKILQIHNVCYAIIKQ